MAERRKPGPYRTLGKNEHDKLRILSQAYIACGGNLRIAMGSIGERFETDIEVRRGRRWIKRAREHGYLREVMEASEVAIDATKTLKGLAEIALCQTPEQQRLEKMGAVCDMSKYIVQSEIQTPAGKIRQVLGVDVEAIQRDGLGHMIRSIQEDKVTFHNPTPPNEALLKARGAAWVQFCKILGLEKSSGENEDRIREIRERVLVLLSSDREARRMLDALSGRALGSARVLDITAEAEASQ